ncbi:MAG: cysteine-rich repeat protein, partial [Hyphomicrobiaceae bacterium]
DLEVCGNGETQSGEECDDGNTADGDGCDSTCDLEVCGNGETQSGEECDDGGTTDGDGCDSTCDLEVCGNGETQSGEECDDGNTADGDGCDSTCDLEVCGNGETQSGEECDDGGTADGDGCDSTCDLEVCGNGETQSGEECDDGNTAVGDGCDELCVLEICGNGISQAGEECDDGNTNDMDSCKNDCTENVCGDGVVETGVEDCDPGADVPGDCCSAACLFEAVTTSCTDFVDPGAAPECNAGACNATGVCETVVVNNGGVCTPDAVNQCVKSYECAAGSCVEDELFLTGHACDWLVVGGGNAGGRVQIVDSSVNTGDICVEFGLVGSNTRINGSIVSNSGATDAIRFRQEAFVLEDIITAGGNVKGDLGVDLPGLLNTNNVAGGTILAKTPGGEYNTNSGMLQDARVDECTLAQVDVAASNVNVEALVSTASHGVISGVSWNVDTPNCGGVNVIDYEKVDLGNFATINLADNCGDNTDTVLIIRVGVVGGNGLFDTNQQSTWNLTNGLNPSNILIYSTSGHCEIGDDNTGGGTIMCPNGNPVQIKNGSVWDGQALGGTGKVIIGDATTFTFVPFTGF